MVKIDLKDRINNREVQATLRQARFSDVPIWKDWKIGFIDTNEADKDWDWEKLIRESLNNNKYKAYVITHECKVQGLMHLKVDKEKKEVYVEYVSTSPFNRNPYREFEGVGTALILKAIKVSFEKDFEGKISLASEEDILYLVEIEKVAPLWNNPHI